jgi:hypothetical protein
MTRAACVIAQRSEDERPEAPPAPQDSREREQAIPETVSAYCRVETQVVTGRAYREVLRIAEEHTRT